MKRWLISFLQRFIPPRRELVNIKEYFYCTRCGTSHNSALKTFVPATYSGERNPQAYLNVGPYCESCARDVKLKFSQSKGL